MNISNFPGFPPKGDFSPGEGLEMKKGWIPAIIILLIFCSGCISNTGEINKLSGDINQHLKKGDGYYNEAADNVNNYRLKTALEKCESATSEYNTARLLASEALSYARDSGDEIFIKYLELVIAEIDAKLNATSELKNAIQLLSINENESANYSLGLANKFMEDAKYYESQRNEIVNKNPHKFI